MMKRIVILIAFCGLIKLILAALPESAILASFCRVPAEVAAFYPKFGSRGFRYCRIANEPVAFPVTGFVRSET